MLRGPGLNVVAIVALASVLAGCTGVGGARPARLAADPVEWNLGLLPPSAAAEQTVMLTNTGDRTATVTTVELVGEPEFSLTGGKGHEGSTLAEGEFIEIGLGFTAGDPGFHSAQLRVTWSDLDRVRVSELGLRALVQEPGLTAARSFVDFGPVPMGSQRTESLAVAVLGIIHVEIADIEVSDPRIAVRLPDGVGPLPVIAGPGESLNLQVDLSADSDDPITGSITIYALDAPDLVIEVLANDCRNSRSSRWDADRDGYSSCFGDCDDSDPTVNPGTSDIFDGRDNDCDGVASDDAVADDDDGDGYCDNVIMCSDPSQMPGDCHDEDPTAHPDAVEDPDDGVDNNCDGTVDEGSAWVDDDGDGVSEREGDCDDNDPEVAPGGAETGEPDGVDNNCDGRVDEGLGFTDGDADGYPAQFGDCDDRDPLTHPHAVELCLDELDNDCDELRDAEDSDECFDETSLVVTGGCVAESGNVTATAALPLLLFPGLALMGRRRPERG